MMKKIHCTIMATLCLWLLWGEAHASEVLIPVGQVVGLELRNDSVSIAAFDDALGSVARKAGLQIGDEILDIDGITVDDAADVRQALTHSDGQIRLRILRKDKEHQLSLTPQVTAAGPRLGVYLRQGVTGIGTVTWYDPASGRFGTLGHGVNDAKGDLVEVTEGTVYAANVLSVKRGKYGEPGQLRGGVDTERTLGTIAKNTPQGVFGRVEAGWTGDTVETAPRSQVKTGPATIRSTVTGTAPKEYSVEILKIYPGDRPEGRNMLLKVTDPDLLSTTGGIVQGMSGSPIIQNGKLVGAVTHVLVNDPTTGYGIFIENMLNAA
jgi:stage IV sporulation protein B